MFHWKPTHPRIFGEYKLVLIGWGRKKTTKRLVSREGGVLGVNVTKTHCMIFLMN